MFYEIDTSGFFIGDVLYREPSRLYVEAQPAAGFIRPRWGGDAWVEGGVQTITPETIATRRYKAETVGITLNYIQISTADRSKLLINGAALEATIDPEYTMQWKTPDGFVVLTASEVIVIARAVRAHVQACFDREAVLLQALQEGALTDEMLEQGWPESQ